MTRFWTCLIVTLLLTARSGAQALLPAPDLYKRAVNSLHEGHFFESAIRDLTEAVRQDPKNADYHRALGDAEADRAGSLAYAAWMTDALLNVREPYVIMQRAWQAAQKDPTSEGYGWPAPPAPPAPDIQFQTKDDLKYLRLTGVQAVARIGELGRAAQSEWAQAVKLSRSPAERAIYENARGWGLLFLVRLLEQTDYPPEKVPGAPTRAAAVKTFTVATKDDPTKADVWQGLGDAYLYKPYNDETHEAAIIAAYQKAIALGTRDPSLRYRLYTVQLKQHPKDAYETLKAASLAYPDNGYVQGLLAEALFSQVRYGDVYNKATEGKTPADFAQAVVTADNDTSRQVAQDALAALERGIAADDYYVPTYAPLVPKTLRHAWDYWNVWEYPALSQGTRMRNLARNVAGYADVAAREGDTDNAVRACRDCITLGQKMAGDMPLHSSSPDSGDVMRGLVGVAIAMIGASELQKVFTLAGQPLLAQQADQQAESLKQQSKAYLDAVTNAPDDGRMWGQY